MKVFFGQRRGAPDGGYTRIPAVDVVEMDCQTSPTHTPLQSSRLKLSRDDVLRWLLESSEEDCHFVLAALARSRGKLFDEGTMGDTGAAPSSMAVPAVAASPSTIQRSRLTSPEQVRNEPPIVQFTASIFYALEGTSQEKAHVMRIGDLTQRSAVAYCTSDSGDCNVVDRQEGVLVFEAGESTKIIPINLKNDESFNGVSEFTISLLHENALNACLGRYLWKARIKVIDDDTFPSNFYETEIRQGLWTNIWVPRLMFEYFKLNTKLPKVRVGAIPRVLGESLHNVYFLLQMFMSIYLVDVVLNIHTPVPEHLFGGDRRMNLMVVMAITCAPFFARHVIDYQKHSWGVGGGSRQFLQKNLVTKFLTLNDDSRQDMRPGDLIMAIQRDSVFTVHHGYMNVLKIVQHMGGLTCLLIFQCTAPIIFHRPMRIMALSPHLIYPVLCFGFLYMRSVITTRVLGDMNDTDNHVVDNISQTVECYRMIADYNQRPQFIERNVRGIKNYASARRSVSSVLENNTYFMMWMSIIIVTIWTWYGGLEVMNGRMTLGIFLTTLRTFEKIGSSWKAIYTILMDMQKAYPGLQRIVQILNLQSDMQQRYDLSNIYMAETTRMRTALMERRATDGLPSDLLPMVLQNVHLTYGSGDQMRTIRIGGKAELAQGQLICLVGGHGSGRSTLLRMVGGAVLPNLSPTKELMIFVPSHLRVLHVPMEPCFFFGPLLSNVLFGVSQGDVDGDLTRVLTICRLLCMDDNVIQHLQSDTVLPWHDVLTATQCSKLCIARALVANPEVLCVHKPTQAYDDSTAAMIVRIMREFVERKGIEEEQGSWNKRRPRTCVITSSKPCGLDLCDHVIHVSQRGYECVSRAADGSLLLDSSHFGGAV